jgi:peptidoglycan-associated lipoprotein
METAMKKLASMTLLLAAAILLAGCPKKPTVPEAPSAKTQVPASATTSGAGEASTTGNSFGDDAAAAAAARAGNVIYFDFDKSEIKPEFAGVVSAAAKNLSSHPSLKVKLEGNTDERGTREYNIGLGERRAQAVRRALLLEGAAEGQITTVSFGAERPAVEGDTEEAWAKNRRVEFNYQASQP